MNTLYLLKIFHQGTIHILVIPKKKYLKYDDFLQNASKDEILHFFKLLNDLISKFNLENSGYELITNAGDDANQEVPQFALSSFRRAQFRSHVKFKCTKFKKVINLIYYLYITINRSSGKKIS